MSLDKGLTLIEILVAIAVISTAIAVAIPNLRKFSEEQTFKDNVSYLLELMRRAQTNSQARVRCTQDDGTLVPSHSWRIVLDKDGSKYKLKIACFDGNSEWVDLAYQLPEGLEIQSYQLIYQSGTKCEPGANNTLTAQFNNLANKVSFGVKNVPCKIDTVPIDDPAQPMQLIISLKKQSNNATVTISSGGSIYANY